VVPGHSLRRHRIFTTSVSSVYPAVAKLERKGRTNAELDEVIAAHGLR
jgi:hypothetical protein